MSNPENNTDGMRQAVFLPGMPIKDADGQQAVVMATEGVGPDLRLMLQLASGEQVQTAARDLVQEADGTLTLPWSFAAMGAARRMQEGNASSENIIVPVVQEVLQVQKRTIDTGAGVRVHKTVSEHEQHIDEPLLHDALEIRHVPIGRLVEGDAPTVRNEGDTIIVPVLEEVLVVEKRVRLKEELHITRKQHELRRPQTVTLKSEHVSIERFDDKQESSSGAGLSNNTMQDKSHPGMAAGQPLLQENIMANTLVGVYDDYTQAQNAMNELIGCGIDRGDMQLTPEEASDTARTSTLRGTTTTDTSSDDHSFGSGIRNFFHHLFGGDDNSVEHADVYSEAVRRGHYLLTVNAQDDEQSEQAMEIMNRYNPVDIDERASQWKSRGWSQYDASAPALSAAEIEQDRRDYATGGTTEGTTIPVIQEEVQVGKREVQRGGVRVYQRVKETPVNESVQLREEHVNVERRPVNQPASEADLAALKEGSFEVRETAEEAVVAKTARVVEEVVVGKQATERTQQINDTVRSTDVEVEQLGAGQTSDRTTGSTIAAGNLSDDDQEYRRHWESTYGRDGGEYNDYAQAYRYGSSLAGDERYRGYRWDEAEPRMRQDWETQHAGTPWEKAKNAVRYGWEKVTR